MPTASLSYYTNLGGLAIQAALSRTASGQISHQLTLAAGKQSTAWTKTDANTGTATLASGHGIIQDDKVDVFWDGGVRYNMDAITVAGNDVTVDGGAGDDLPASDTTMVLCTVTELDTDFDGDLASLIVAHTSRRGHMTFLDSGDAVLHAVELPADEGWYWADEQGVTNPLTGNPVDRVQVSNGDPTNTSTAKLGVLYDSEV